MAKKQPKTILGELLNQELPSAEKATFITEYAGSYYFLIMSENCPDGIVQFFNSEYCGLSLHCYTPIQGLVNSRLINAFEKVATTYNNSMEK